MAAGRAWTVVVVSSAASTPVVGAWRQCQVGPIGSCSMLGCNHSAKNQGPTKCVGDKCMCVDGYCDAGTKTHRCRARVGVCTVLPCDWHVHGNASGECINGFCLCRPGYYAGKDNICLRDDDDLQVSVLSAAAATQDSEGLAREEELLRRRERRAPRPPGDRAALAACGALTLAAASAGALLRVRWRRRRCPDAEEPAYQRLVGG